MKPKAKTSEKSGSKKKASSGARKSRSRKKATDTGVARQAARYSKTRRDHSSEIAEDYVELIGQLIRQHGEARTVDIAKRLGVSHVTATKTIARLQREGLIRTKPYRSIFLTDQGERLARHSEARHELVVAFLGKLGVNAVDAEIDAEGIEHHVGPATMAAIRRYVEEHS